MLGFQTNNQPSIKTRQISYSQGGSKTGVFLHLDLSQAYQQLILNEASKKYAVVNTHTVRFNWLPYGISSAPGIFQQVMESLLLGIPGVVMYIDDILITGETLEQHLNTL